MFQARSTHVSAKVFVHPFKLTTFDHCHHVNETPVDATIKLLIPFKSVITPVSVILDPSSCTPFECDKTATKGFTVSRIIPLLKSVPVFPALSET